ncbi:MAG: type transport system ATP-binding protein [Gaiellaceae bacterium]|nr:type transport system ATP-binding protein [Gaiellaceae bacterium]
MIRSRAALLVLAAALAFAPASAAARADTPTTQSIAIEMSDHVLLACGLTLPTGSAPADGWPGVLLFPGLGKTHATMDAMAVASFAPDGLASLACDERGTGASGGSFDLAGPRDVQDVQDLHDWLAARADVVDAEIGAFGISVGGAEVWNAAAAGVPFQAIVPDGAWTSLARALKPGGVVKSALFDVITALGPPVGWDSASGLAARSSRSVRLTGPTIDVHGRHDFLFDLDQARSGFNRLDGSRFLEIATTPRALPDITGWLYGHLAGDPPPVNSVKIGTRTYTGLPRSRFASVNLPGATTLTPEARVARTVRLTGGPFTTFGDGSVTVRYTGASSWDRLVATVSLAGSTTPLTDGAARITQSAGIVKIRLMNEMAVVPRGKAIVVRIGATSPDSLFADAVPDGASIRITRVTFTPAFLDR